MLVSRRTSASAHAWISRSRSSGRLSTTSSFQIRTASAIAPEGRPPIRTGWAFSSTKLGVAHSRSVTTPASASRAERWPRLARSTSAPRSVGWSPSPPATSATTQGGLPTDA